MTQALSTTDAKALTDQIGMTVSMKANFCRAACSPPRSHLGITFAVGNKAIRSE